MSGELLRILGMAYLPGIVAAGIVWMVARRSAPMPIYFADLLGLVLPVVLWFVLQRLGWSAVAKHPDALLFEAALLGGIWGVLFIARLLVPRFTHKLRFRLAAIHVGSITALAAVLLALFLPCLPR